MGGWLQGPSDHSGLHKERGNQAEAWVGSDWGLGPGRVREEKNAVFRHIVPNVTHNITVLSVPLWQWNFKLHKVLGYSGHDLYTANDVLIGGSGVGNTEGV